MAWNGTMNDIDWMVVVCNGTMNDIDWLIDLPIVENSVRVVCNILYLLQSKTNPKLDLNYATPSSPPQKNIYISLEYSLLSSYIFFPLQFSRRKWNCQNIYPCMVFKKKSQLGLYRILVWPANNFAGYRISGWPDSQISC